MDIISWNVNGLRALVRTGDWDFLAHSRADVLCLQETKAEPEQLPDEVRKPKGWHTYFAWSKGRRGYSGTAIYAREKPDKVHYSLGEKVFDDEGRYIEVHFGKIVLCNVYFPNGGAGNKRVSYKLAFYDAFLARMEALRTKGASIIFCGDVNTAHEEIDLARPKENSKNTGFLPEERAWLDEVVHSGYIDVFRHLHPSKRDAYTYWDMKTRARDRNVGWRIDYFFVSANLIHKVQSMKHLTDVFGSDHCPIEMKLE